MSKKFDVISIILICILIVMLFFVVFNYFTKSTTLSENLDLPTNIQTPSSIIYGDNKDLVIESNSSGNNLNDNSHTIINIDYITKNNSGDAVLESGENLSESGEKTDVESGEKLSGDSGNTDSNVPKAPEQTAPKDSTPLIITSADDISSKEKKEVLKELDQTLMELLEVVDSVQTVDETRLITDESGVQE